MNKVKQFMNKITDKGATDPSSGALQQSFADSEGQVSAEGFLCPDCMTAFPSPEALAEHYASKHGAAGAMDNKSLDFDASTDLESALTQQELYELRCALTEERKHSAELQHEISTLRSEFKTRKGSVGSSNSKDNLPENDHEGAGGDNRKQDEQVPQLIEQIKRLSKDARERSAEAEELKFEIKRLETLAFTRTKESIESEKGLREECSTLRNQTEKLELNYNRVQKELQEYKETTADAVKRQQETVEQLNTVTTMLKLEEQSHLDNVNLLKEKLSMKDNQSKIAEAENEGLRQEAQRLREQHAELVSRIEGDEATEAAIESLNKERDTLKDYLESSQVQNRELSKNLHNIGLELEKSRNEYKTITAKFEEAKHKLEDESKSFKSQLAAKDQTIGEQAKKCAEVTTVCDTLKTQLMERSAELLRLETVIKEKDNSIGTLRDASVLHLQEIEELKAAIASLTKELKSSSERAVTGEIAIATLKEDLVRSTEQIEKFKMELTVVESANQALKSAIVAEKEAKEAVEASLQKALDDSAALTEEFRGFREDHTAAVTNLSSCIDDLTTNSEAAQKEFATKLDKVTKELRQAEKDLEKSRATCQKLSEELKCQQESDAVKLENLQKELERTENLADEKSKAAKKLEEELNLLKEEMVALRVATTRFQDDRDAFQAEKLELDKKFKSSEEARSLLLDRCLVGESEAEKSQETIQGLQRKLGDSLAALQELGRENQSLQVESAKLQGRKWADDSIVTTCCTCSKEFSITIRKHHCRVCGNIFCHECSSKTASIPSSKKPVRVCDACCDELSTK